MFFIAIITATITAIGTTGTIVAMSAAISGISAGIIVAGAARCTTFTGIPDTMAATAALGDSADAPTAW